MRCGEWGAYVYACVYFRERIEREGRKRSPTPRPVPMPCARKTYGAGEG